MLFRKMNPFIFERTDNRNDYEDKDGTGVYKMGLLANLVLIRNIREKIKAIIT